MLIHKIIMLVVISLVAIALASAPTLAMRPESTSRSVRYADLDLSSRAGIKALHRRIAAAVEAVCGSYEGTDTAAAAEEYRQITRCRATALADLGKQSNFLNALNSRLGSTH